MLYDVVVLRCLFFLVEDAVHDQVLSSKDDKHCFGSGPPLLTLTTVSGHRATWRAYLALFRELRILCPQGLILSPRGHTGTTSQEENRHYPSQEVYFSPTAGHTGTQKDYQHHRVPFHLASLKYPNASPGTSPGIAEKRNSLTTLQPTYQLVPPYDWR